MSLVLGLLFLLLLAFCVLSLGSSGLGVVIVLDICDDGLFLLGDAAFSLLLLWGGVAFSISLVGGAVLHFSLC